ncbi:MAG: YcxB family protein [Clostridia bacterium]|nr:YcxB family protein [Clostridia bacterium]
MEKVKVKMEYNEKVLKDYFKSHFKTLSYITLIAGIIVVLAGAVLCFTDAFVLGIFACIFGVVVMLYVPMLIIISLNANKRSLNKVDYYEFNKDSFKIVSTILIQEVAKHELQYSELLKFVEYKNYIYLYINKASALVVDKNSLQQEQVNFILNSVKKYV